MINKEELDEEMQRVRSGGWRAFFDTYKVTFSQIMGAWALKRADNKLTRLVGAGVISDRLKEYLSSLEIMQTAHRLARQARRCGMQKETIEWQLLARKARLRAIDQYIESADKPTYAALIDYANGDTT